MARINASHRLTYIGCFLDASTYLGAVLVLTDIVMVSVVECPVSEAFI